MSDIVNSDANSSSISEQQTAMMSIYYSKIGGLLESYSHKLSQCRQEADDSQLLSIKSLLKEWSSQLQDTVAAASAVAAAHFPSSSTTNNDASEQHPSQHTMPNSSNNRGDQISLLRQAMHESKEKQDRLIEDMKASHAQALDLLRTCQ